MKKPIIYIICTLAFGFASFISKPAQKTLLHIVAHPDDEMAIADVLVKYSRSGYKVIVMIATDGRDGTRVTSIPPGDSLAKTRRLESICASQKMGIEPPVFLSVERLDTKIGVRNYFNAHKELRTKLVDHISRIKPDVIITFGPDGDSHHSEHIVIGSAVTEVLLQQGWVDKYPLYYIAYINQTKSLDGELGYMADKYINVEIKYSEQDELIGLDANSCFVSQLTTKELEDDRISKLADIKNTAFFRRFAISKEKRINFKHK